MEHFTLPHQHGQSRDQLMNNIPSTENFQILADIFKQLSDTTRIRIFWILCHCLPHQHGQSRDQLMNNIPSTENFQILADIFKQLSDTTRIRIFWILCHC